MDSARVVASIHCGGAILATNLFAVYDAVQFSGGAVFVSGVVGDPGLQSSGSNIYAPTQNGWADAPVFITFDAFGNANGGWWRLSLDRNTLVTSLVYNDSELPDAGQKRTWTMMPGQCVVNRY